jgi:hypothetical protein
MEKSRMFGEDMMEIGSLVRSKSGWFGVVKSTGRPPVLNFLEIYWISGWKMGVTQHIHIENLEKIA